MEIRKVILILVGVLLIFLGFRYFSWNSGDDKLDVTLDERKTLSIEGINLIDINLDIGIINITSEDIEELSLHYYSEGTTSARTTLIARTSGNKIDISGKSKKNLNINTVGKNIYLDIVVPTKFSDNIDLESNLGTIIITGLELNKLDVEGDLGDINIKDTITKEANVSADLGAVKIFNLHGDLDAETDLGSIHIEYDSLNSNLRAKSDAGSIKLILAKDSDFYLDAKTELGSIDTDFPLEIDSKSNRILQGKLGDGNNKINLSVELGSIKINSK